MNDDLHCLRVYIDLCVRAAIAVLLYSLNQLIGLVREERGLPLSFLTQ